MREEKIRKKIDELLYKLNKMTDGNFRIETTIKMKEGEEYESLELCEIKESGYSNKLFKKNSLTDFYSTLIVFVSGVNTVIMQILDCSI